MKEESIPFDTDTAFFINADGQPLYSSHNWPINWGDFACASGIPKVKNYTFRHNMSQVLTAQKRTLLTECEEWALCHAPGTREKYYSDQQAKMVESLMVQEFYQQHVAGQ